MREFYLEEEERFPMLLPINKLREDSWFSFLERQGVSSPSAHLTTLSSCSGQLLQGLLQGILDADNHLRCVREKAPSPPRRLGDGFHSHLLSPGQGNNERSVAEKRPPIQHTQKGRICVS